MFKTKFQVHSISRPAFNTTVTWVVIVCLIIVCSAAALGRATRNFKAALTDKPDIAIYLLLPKEGLGNTTLISSKDNDTERAYMADTKDGPKLITLKKGPREWYVESEENLHQ